MNNKGRDYCVFWMELTKTLVKTRAFPILVSLRTQHTFLNKTEEGKTDTIFFLFFQISLHKAQLGTKKISQGGGGLARVSAETVYQETCLRWLVRHVAQVLLAAAFDAHFKVADVTNVGEVSRSFASCKSDVVLNLISAANWCTVFSMLAPFLFCQRKQTTQFWL